MSLENNGFLTNEQKKEEKVLFQNHEIKLESGEGAIEFSEDHKKKIMEVLNRFSEIDPELIKNYSKFESSNIPDAKHFGIFPANAIIIGDKVGNDYKYGISFTNAGMNTDEPHRTSLSKNQNEDGFVDNFSGTLAHEITHGGTSAIVFSDKKYNQEFIDEWKEKFGWEHIFPIIKNKETNRFEYSKEPISGWEKNENGGWKKGDYNIMRTEYTTMSEACIGGKDGYAARVNIYEDICDSVAAYLLNPSILDKEKCEFIKNKINEYKKIKTIQ